MTMQQAPRSSAATSHGRRRLRVIGLGIALGAFFGVTAVGQSATPPQNVTPPVITGAAELGGMLRASPGRWRSAEPLRYTFRWWRCPPTAGPCRRIPVAPGRTYRVTRADFGRALLVRVTARSSLGQARASSPRVAIPDPGATPEPELLFRDAFDRPDGLVTNEWAYRHPDDPAAAVSPDWYTTSGSLFTSDGAGWTGVPDRRAPDAASAGGTGSAVFRLVTRRRDFRDVAVSFALRNDELASTASSPAAWDGVHVFLRYQSPYRLYSASANRRDGTVVIKKKCPGGPSNGGTYHTLSETGDYAVPYGEWQRVVTTVRNLPGGAVELRLEIGGRIVAAAVDEGVGCGTIESAGSVGIRGDNADFRLDDFAVSQLE
jgi:hypothetical protein